MQKSIEGGGINMAECERREIFRALVGSHNYNLNTETSDMDYKIFVAPTFDDLYFGKQYSNSIIGEAADYDYHDIRKISDLFWKSNINFMEILFSKSYEVLSNVIISFCTIHNFYEIKDRIARINLPYLYNACLGMHHTKISQIDKGTSGTQPLVDKFGYDCYSEDTLFLTDSGWKLYDSITERDLLATVNPKNHSLEYQKYFERVKKPHKGIMYEMDNVYSNCLVTGNHRMYASPVINRNKLGVNFKPQLANWDYNSMENLINGKRSYFHILTTPVNNNTEYNISDDLLTLIGLYVSEGTMQFRKSGVVKSVILSQSINGKKEFFDKMSTIKTYKFKAYTHSNETKWISHDKELTNFLYYNCGHKSENKRLPNFVNKLSKRQADILLYSLYLGDGTVKKSNSKTYGIVYYTINKKLAEDVQNLALLCEKDSLLWGGEKGYKSISNFNGKDLFTYQVYVKDAKSVPKTMIFKEYTGKGRSSCLKGIETHYYDGNIVCFSVPNENLITQRNGKVAIQGNTKQAMHSIRVLQFLKRYADTEFTDFGDAIWYDDGEPDRKFLLDVKGGAYSKDSIVKISKDLYSEVVDKYGQRYLKQSPNEELHQRILSDVKNIVMAELFTPTKREEEEE